MNTLINHYTAMRLATRHPSSAELSTSRWFRHARHLVLPALITLASWVPSPAEATNWKPVMGGSETNSINVNAGRSLSGPHLTVVGSKLYASWREPNAASVSQVRMAVYNGNDDAPAWELVDRSVNGISRTREQGLNANPSVSVNSNLSFAAVQNTLYASWIENGRVRVARYNGNDEAPDWTFVDFGANGVNYSGTKAANAPRMVSFQGELFVFWLEEGPKSKGAAAGQARARKYTGTSWAWVDGGKATGLNVDPTKSVTGVRPVVLDGVVPQLYLGFGEVVVYGSRRDYPKVALRVKRYDQGSNSWAIADGGSGVADNYRIGQLSGGADATGIYFAWQEEIRTIDNYVDRWPLRVAYYNAADAAPEWHRLDDPETPGTIQFNPSLSTIPMRLTQFGDQLIFTWSEWGMYAVAGEPKLRARGWDGVNWTWMDGGLAGSSTLHHVPNSEGDSIILATLGGKLYKFTAESKDGPSQGYVSVLEVD